MSGTMTDRTVGSQVIEKNAMIERIIKVNVENEPGTISWNKCNSISQV